MLTDSLAILSTNGIKDNATNPSKKRSYLKPYWSDKADNQSTNDDSPNCDINFSSRPVPRFDNKERLAKRSKNRKASTKKCFIKFPSTFLMRKLTKWGITEICVHFMENMRKRLISTFVDRIVDESMSIREVADPNLTENQVLSERK